MGSSKRPYIFLGVGVFNTLFDFTFYTFLTSFVFKDNDKIAIAGVISGTAALVCAFITHSLITWRGSHISHRTILKFVAFTGFGMWFIRPLLLAGFIRLNGLYSWVFSISYTLHLPFSRDFIVNTGAFGFMAVILLIYNYLTYNRFVFSKKTAKD
ncbi:MAG: GtrA family protein [Cytophaga sp.]|nr:GtrA family protein [Undibacterium sp.]